MIFLLKVKNIEGREFICSLTVCLIKQFRLLMENQFQNQ